MANGEEKNEGRKLRDHNDDKCKFLFRCVTLEIFSVINLNTCLAKCLRKKRRIQKRETEKGRGLRREVNSLKAHYSVKPRSLVAFLS